MSPLKNGIRLFGLALLDRIGSQFGRQPIYIPGHGRPGELSIGATPDGPFGEKLMTPKDGTPWHDRVAARSLLSFFWRRPVRRAASVRIPFLLVVPEADSIAPVPAALEVARRAPGAELFRSAGGHYDVYEGGAGFADVLRTEVELSVALAPMGFAAFAQCMAAGRFAGDRLALKAGPVNTLRISGLFLAGGIGVAVVAHHWLAIALGFALTGFGTANIVPVIYSTTGRLEGRGTSASIAAVATMGYFGFLSGPPLIGFIAAMAGLPVALSLGIISGSVIAIVGAVVVRRVRTAAF